MFIFCNKSFPLTFYLVKDLYDEFVVIEELGWWYQFWRPKITLKTWGFTFSSFDTIIELTMCEWEPTGCKPVIEYKKQESF